MKESKSVIVIAGAFVIIQLLAIAFMALTLTEGDQAFEDPSDPLIAVYYLVMMLGFTLLFLVLIKRGFQTALKWIFYISIGFVVFFVAIVIFRWLIPDWTILQLIGLMLGALSVIGIWKFPEWYVIDALGVVMAIGIVALLGVSLSIIPVLILLVALAVYDAISVYKTKHMLTLAEGVGDMALPLLLIVPKRLPYKYMEKKPKFKAPEGESGEKPEREAFFIGLGDIIIPGLLQASAFWFLPSEGYSFLGMPANLAVALFTIIGGVVGLVVLMRVVLKGNPQAGLPLLNAGTIIGFLISYLVIFGLDFQFLIPG